MAEKILNCRARVNHETTLARGENIVVKITAKFVYVVRISLYGEVYLPGAPETTLATAFPSSEIRRCDS